MGKNSAIEWTTHTFNPWWGCVRVSEACRNCYAEAWAKRTGHGDTWGPSGRRRFLSDSYWRKPLKWNRDAAKAGERHRVFCASMADVFELLSVNHPDAPAMTLARGFLWQLIEDTPHLDWLLLTKRPEEADRIARIASFGQDGTWLPNIWLGTTVEDQATAEERIPHLLKVPAKVRFLSCEPLLGPVNLDALDVAWGSLDWVIAGGESGPGARASDPDWFRSLRDQCATAEVPFLFKQWGAYAPGYRRDPKAFGLPLVRKMVRLGKKKAGRELDGRTWDEVPIGIYDDSEDCA